MSRVLGSSCESCGSLAWEIRLALLEESAHAFAHVGGGRSQAEHVALDHFAFLLAHVEPARDGLEREAERDARARQELVHQLLRARRERRGLEDAVDDA